MIFTDETYYEYEPVKITGLDTSNGISEEVGSFKLLELQRAIKIHERTYMQMLLGKDVADEFYVDFKADPETKKWDDLVSQLRDTDLKRSPLANFVYCEFKREHYIESGDNGDFVAKADNMQIVSPEHKIINAWNDMVNQNEKVCKWIFDNLLIAETPVITINSEIENTMWFTTYGLLRKENGFL